MGLRHHSEDVHVATAVRLASRQGTLCLRLRGHGGWYRQGEPLPRRDWNGNLCSIASGDPYSTQGLAKGPDGCRENAHRSCTENTLRIPMAAVRQPMLHAEAGVACRSRCCMQKQMPVCQTPRGRHIQHPTIGQPMLDAAVLARFSLPAWSSVRVWLLRLQTDFAPARLPAADPVWHMSAPVRRGAVADARLGLA